MGIIGQADHAETPNTNQKYAVGTRRAVGKQRMTPTLRTKRRRLTDRQQSNCSELDPRKGKLSPLNLPPSHQLPQPRGFPSHGWPLVLARFSYAIPPTNAIAYKRKQEHYMRYVLYAKYNHYTRYMRYNL